MLAVDNSASMRELGAHEPAVLSMVAIALALRRLETGDLSIFSFGSAIVRQILPFGSPLDATTGQKTLDALTFDLAGELLSHYIFIFYIYLRRREGRI